VLIYDLSKQGRSASAQFERQGGDLLDLPGKHIRKGAIGLPGVSELQVVRHFTNLSKKKFFD
jgi:glycine dehydrogenase subunit 2